MRQNGVCNRITLRWTELTESLKEVRSVLRDIP